MNLKLDIHALSVFAANKWRIRDKNHQLIYSRGIRRSWPRNIDYGSIEELTSEGWWRVYRGTIDFRRLAVSARNTSLDRDTAKNKSVERYVVVVEISKEWREKEKWKTVRERQENGSFISPIFRGKRSIFSVLSETLQSDSFSYPVAHDVIQEAAREANKRGMVAGGLALNTRATFKGGVIKMAKLLLINLAGPFFDTVPTGTQFVRVERRPPTIRTAFQLDFWFYWNTLTHINRQFLPTSAVIDSVLPFG